ncbi:MAG TPA: orotidine-5'-phosphate decarboxylase [Thermoanaerobaculia bacterium]|nr:orotidine-5'-phosphate decarboxylase [Thermoanaerobaculia bacterium]
MSGVEARDRLIIALDRGSRDQILELADQLQGRVGLLKIGLQAFVSNGPALVRELAGGGHRIFLDLKLHDIPTTARHATREAAALGASMLTVHATGGAAMMNACAQEAPADLLLLGVTILTSIDDQALETIGFRAGTSESVRGLARLARGSGLRGVVAAPAEIALIREELGADMLIVTPGIRPAGSPADDQVRVMTPAEALREGADYIVIGRPVTSAADPRAALDAILESL